MEKNDSELISDYHKGDNESLKLLISRYMKAVYNFTYRLSGNAEEASDITQETFVKAWKNLKKYDSEKKFSTWIFAIARNTSIDWLRKKRPTLFSEFDTSVDTQFEDSIVDDELLQHELFEQRENVAMIERALSSLPVDYKMVILLHNNEDMTFEEISDVLKKPMNTVKSQYRRALIMLKKALHQKLS